MIPDSGSEFIKDIISLDVCFEQIRAWALNHKDLKKKEIVEMMRKIQSKADDIEHKTKFAGFDYFKKVI